MTREQWLVDAVHCMAPLFAEKGITLPPILISVGWAPRKEPHIGGTTYPSCADDCAWEAHAEGHIDTAVIFMSPNVLPPVKSAAYGLSMLLHELTHAGLRSGKHDTRFRDTLQSFGWGEDINDPRNHDICLVFQLDSIAHALGPFPTSRGLNLG